MATPQPLQTMDEYIEGMRKAKVAILPTKADCEESRVILGFQDCVLENIKDMEEKIEVLKKQLRDEEEIAKHRGVIATFEALEERDKEIRVRGDYARRCKEFIEDSEYYPDMCAVSYLDHSDSYFIQVAHELVFDLYFACERGEGFLYTDDPSPRFKGLEIEDEAEFLETYTDYNNRYGFSIETTAGTVFTP